MSFFASYHKISRPSISGIRELLCFGPANDVLRFHTKRLITKQISKIEGVPDTNLSGTPNQNMGYVYCLWSSVMYFR